MTASVCVLVFVACSNAVSSSALRASGGTVSVAAINSSKTLTNSASIPSVTSHEPCFLASSAVASFSSLSPSGTLHKSLLNDGSLEFSVSQFLRIVI